MPWEHLNLDFTRLFNRNAMNNKMYHSKMILQISTGTYSFHNHNTENAYHSCTWVPDFCILSESPEWHRQFGLLLRLPYLQGRCHVRSPKEIKKNSMLPKCTCHRFVHPILQRGIAHEINSTPSHLESHSEVMKFISYIDSFTGFCLWLYHTSSVQFILESRQSVTLSLCGSTWNWSKVVLFFQTRT